MCFAITSRDPLTFREEHRIAGYNTMRYRDRVHTITNSNTWSRYDSIAGTVNQTSAYSETIVDNESLIWDEQGGKSVVNDCVHLSMIVDDLNAQMSVYHPSEGGAAPNWRYRYDSFSAGASTRIEPLRPSPIWANVEDFIPVDNATSDDLGNCIFNAYNQLVTSVRSLDASVSILESGETPRLFTLWQRRRALPSNLVSGFLSYSFGWKPLLSDLRAVQRELRSFPATVRKRLKSIGDGFVVRHFKFSLKDTVADRNVVLSSGQPFPYDWSKFEDSDTTLDKSRVVIVTIRAKVKPKLTGAGQELLNQLGALGLIPSLSTVWSLTRLSFVVDWFYNIGGAIENLQGSLTHDISDVSVCVSDARTRKIEMRCADTGGFKNHVIGVVNQRYYRRYKAAVPILPSLRLPTRPMNYVLLGLLSLGHTKSGAKVLRLIDGTPLSKEATRLINLALPKASLKRGLYF